MCTDEENDLSRIRVLIVDDSAFMRRVIRQMLEDSGDVEVVGAARDGAEGVEMALSLKPDVITMDIEMPRVNGLEATERIMEQMPTAIIMVSSLTVEGAKATFEALDKGAADFISKNLTTSALDLMKIQEEFLAKIRAVAKRKHYFTSLRLPRDPRLSCWRTRRMPSARRPRRKASLPRRWLSSP
jgi:two-component system chemotaxis response regulator CheB